MKNKKHRRKSSIAYSLIIFAIATVFLLSLFVWDSSKVAGGNTFSIEVRDNEEAFEAKYIKRIDGDAYIYQGDLITDALVEEIKDIGGIKDVCLGTKVSVLFENIQFPGKGAGNWNYELEKREASKGYGVYYGSGYTVASEDLYNVLQGFNDTKLSKYFKYNVLKLVDGKHITDEDGHKVLISEELAELNQLSVGDTFTSKMKLYDSLQRGLGGTIMEIELEVAGIFRVNKEQDLTGYPLKEDIAVNYMFTNNTTVKEYDQMYRQVFILDEESVYTSADFTVRNPLRLTEIMKKAQGKMDTSYLRTTTSTELERDVAKAYHRVTKTSLVLACWFAVSGFMFLVLLFRKRKVTKADLAAVGLAILLATGVAFVGTGITGDLMLKFVGVEATEEEERDSMELPLTVKERRAYYESYELKCDEASVNDFQRDISVMTIVLGEAVLVFMCGAAVALRKKNIRKKIKK